MSTERPRANIDPVSPRPVVLDEERVVRGEDLYGQGLGNAEYSRYTFIDSDWTESSTAGAAFDHCTFSGVRFNATRHVGSAFVNCIFSRCSMFDVRFDQCKLTGSLFQQSTFGLFEVHGGDWSFVGLPGADLRKCVFDGVRMREVDLTAARLDKSVLTLCDLSGAMLHSAQMSGADLRGSNISALDPLVTAIGGARIDEDQAGVIATSLGFTVG